MKIGIISFAHLHAYSYLEKLLENEEVDWIGFYDENKKRRNKISEEHNIKGYSNIKDLMCNNLDGIIITSENSRHSQHVREIAKYQVPILCEKPLADNLESAKKMIEVCEKQSVDLGVCYPVRYLSSIISLKNKIQEGVIGEIKHITASNHGSFPGGWFANPELSGGGAIMDHTVHIADIIYWMTGAKAEKVVAMTENMRDLPVEDLALLNIEWDQDFDLTLDASWSRNDHYPTWGDVKLKIYGTKGVIEVDSLNQNNIIYSDQKNKAVYDYWGDDMDNYLIDDFVECIKKKKDFPISAKEGLESLKVVEMAYNYLSNKKEN